MGEGRFDLGRVCVTFRARAELEEREIESAQVRHARGDWGFVPDVVREANERHLGGGVGRIVSGHVSETGIHFYLITDRDLGRTLYAFEDEVRWSATGEPELRFD